MKPRSMSTPRSRTRRRSPTSSGCGPCISLPSMGGVATRTQVPFARRAGDDRVELVADARRDHHRGRGLPHLTLDLVRRVLLLRAMRRELLELAEAYGAGCPASDAFSSRCVITSGIAPVGRGRVRVVLHRQAEVPRRLRARRIDDVLAAAEQPDHAWSRDPETSPDPRPCAWRETPRARRNRRPPAACRRSAPPARRIRSQRSGDFTTRRSDGKLCASR